MLLYRIIIVTFILFATTSINAQSTRQHTIMRGETFSSIANKYGITEQQLKNANSAYSTCYVGLKLTIPAKDTYANPKTSTVVSENNKSKIVTPERPHNNVSKTTEITADSKIVKKKKQEGFWEKFDAALTATSDALTIISDGLNQKRSVSTPTYITNNPPEQNLNGNMLLITDLIRANELRIVSCEKKIEKKIRELDQKTRQNQQNRPSYIRVGGKYISLGNKEQQKQKKYTRHTTNTNTSTTVVVNPERYSRNVEIISLKAVIKKYQSDNQWLYNYRRKNGEYIPQETYNNYLSKQKELHEENHKRNIENMHKTSQALRFAYEEYEQQLQKAYNDPINYGLTKSEIKHIQNEMRKIREKSGHSKSSFEDWNGISRIYE